MRSILFLFFLVIFSVAVSAVDLSDPNLVGYWELKSNCSDLKGNYHGTPSGGLKCGRSEIKFDGHNVTSTDGSTKSITLPQIMSNNWDNMTVSAWYNHPYQYQGESYIFHNQYNYQKVGFRFGIQGTGYQCSVGKNTTDYQLTSQSVSNLARDYNDTWYHVATTYVRNGNMTTYVNGMKMITKPVGDYPVSYSGSTPHIFYYYNTPDATFNGSAYGIGIWNRSLSEEEIQELVREEIYGDDHVNLSINSLKKSFPINMSFDTQEKQATYYFVNNWTIRDRHKQMLMERPRIWLLDGFQSAMYDTIPIMDDCTTYNFDNLSLVLQAYFNMNASRYLIQFANARQCMRMHQSSSDSAMVRNITEYVNYINSTLVWLNHSCAQGNLTNCPRSWQYDFSDWNEPHSSDFWGADMNYTQIYNASYPVFKINFPNCRVGTAGSLTAGDTEDILRKFYGNITNCPDVHSYHGYGASRYADPSHPEYDNRSTAYFTLTAKYTDYTRILSWKLIIQEKCKNTVIINDEYNADSVYTPRSKINANESTNPWRAESIIFGMKADVRGESFFQGTESHSNALWNYSGTQPYPWYNVKVELVKRFQKGQTAIETVDDDLFFDSLSTKNSSMFVNAKDRNISVEITLDNPDIAYAYDESGTKISFINRRSNISLEQYGIRFLDYGCVYGGNGGFMINTSEGCSQYSQFDEINNGVTILGDQRYTITTNIKVSGDIRIQGDVHCEGGCFV